jgi:hypothetical protein
VVEQRLQEALLQHSTAATEEEGATATLRAAVEDKIAEIAKLSSPEKEEADRCAEQNVT